MSRPRPFVNLVRPLLVATASLALAGCYANTVTSDRQITKDGWLASHARVRVVRQTRVSDDLLRIDVEVENTLPFDTRFDYRFDFVDGEGRQLFMPTAGFRQQQVPAGAFVTITATATSPDATDFRLTLTNAD
ncbi:MAG: DUF1425 domain-containing protein [Planctomycetota bacterium]|nr:DUF1425 domain-containing protein [Planctomycetota bacterium]